MQAHLHDYQRIERIIQRIEREAQAQPQLAALAAAEGISPEHLQKLFTRWAGISPKRFLQHVTLSRAQEMLVANANLLETSLELGLSGPSRLHDLFIAAEGMSPGMHAAGGPGLVLRYGLAPTPFGRALLAWSDKGLCRLDYPTGWEEAGLRAGLARHWPRAELHRDEAGAAALAARIFTPVETGLQRREPLALHLKGTNFQLKVWRALLRIPSGALTSYGALARHIGHDKAVRAVGSAVGDNPIAWLIPCHRVLRSDGGIGGYATGTARKRAMLVCELE